MRKLSLGCLLASTALAACGGNSEASAPVWKVIGTPNPPQVQVPSGPPPAKVVVKELREGDGVPLKEGDWFKLNYVAYYYKSGKEKEAHWEKTGGFNWELRKGRIVKGWVPGLRGMRVGGLRELLVPSRLAYHDGPLVYVVELVEVEPPQPRETRSS